MYIHVQTYKCKAAIDLFFAAFSNAQHTAINVE